jgi:hypothetical protein
VRDTPKRIPPAAVAVDDAEPTPAKSKWSWSPRRVDAPAASSDDLMELEPLAEAPPTTAHER